jgi:hypothetical protein
MRAFLAQFRIDGPRLSNQFGGLHNTTDAEARREVLLAGRRPETEPQSIPDADQYGRADLGVSMNVYIGTDLAEKLQVVEKICDLVLRSTSGV